MVKVELAALERANTVDGIAPIIVVKHFEDGKLTWLLNEVTGRLHADGLKTALDVSNRAATSCTCNYLLVLSCARRSRKIFSRLRMLNLLHVKPKSQASAIL